MNKKIPGGIIFSCLKDLLGSQYAIIDETIKQEYPRCSNLGSYNIGFESTVLCRSKLPNQVDFNYSILWNIRYEDDELAFVRVYFYKGNKQNDNYVGSVAGFQGDKTDGLWKLPELSVIILAVTDIHKNVDHPNDKAVLNLTYKGLKAVVTKKVRIIQVPEVRQKEVVIQVPVQVTKKIPISMKINCYSNPGKFTPLMINCCMGKIEVPIKVEPNVPANHYR